MLKVIVFSFFILLYFNIHGQSVTNVTDTIPDTDLKYHICENTSIQLIATAYTGSGSTLPFKFNWNHLDGSDNPQVIEVAPIESTTYNVTVTDAKRQKFSQSHEVILEPVSILSIRSNPTCPNTSQGLISISAIGNRLQYSIDGGRTFQRDSIFSNLHVGEYKLVVKNQYGCRSIQNTRVSLKDDLEACSEDFRQYSTRDYHSKTLKEDVDYTTDRKQIARQSRRWRKNTEYKNIEFQLVFHFLTDVTRNTVEDLVSSQLAALNRDFGAPELTGRLDTTYHHRAANMQMSFALAPDGIKMKFDTSLNITSFNVMKDRALGGLNSISPDQHINIWVCNLPDSIHSYAQMPGGRQITDGIVIDQKYLGQHTDRSTLYNTGKTLTHLMGSFFGLKPLYGWYKCGNDGVHDTPIHNVPFRKCIAKNLTSTCDGRKAMQENFMSASPDNCQYMFTLDQKKKVHAKVYSDPYRQSLIQNKE